MNRVGKVRAAAFDGRPLETEAERRLARRYQKRAALMEVILLGLFGSRLRPCTGDNCAALHYVFGECSIDEDIEFHRCWSCGYYTAGEDTYEGGLCESCYRVLSPRF